MSKSWYFIQTFVGYEQKIEQTIRVMLEKGELDKSIVADVYAPVASVEEIKDGKKKIKKDKAYSGYVMVELDLPELGWKDTCAKIRRVQGVNGFACTSPNVRPRPISPDEVKKIFEWTGRIKSSNPVAVKVWVEKGDQVKITDGAFVNLVGAVEEVNAEKGKVRVMVPVFGRPTPVEVDLTQVEKI